MTVNVKKKKKKDTSPGLPSSLLAWFHSKDISSACVWCLCTTTHTVSDYVHTHSETHTKILRGKHAHAQNRLLILSLSYLFIVQVPQRMITRKKEEKNKPSMEEYVPFEVVFLLGIGFGVTWLLKQIIKCNGWRGLQSFISNGKNKVLDDLGDSGAGFDGNSHACWNSLLWNILICANRQVLS